MESLLGNVPVYVMRYATTIQPVWLKPCKSSVIATSEVLTIEISMFGRKMANEMLKMHTLNQSLIYE